MKSPSIEDYVKAIYKATEDTGAATTHGIAARVGVSLPAVSKMLRRLSDLSLVEHAPYRGVWLTEAGTRMALEIIRHHRLLEMYLVEALGYRWDEVHEEAERLEHHISEDLEARIDAYLGHPEFDPHGDPIPTLDGRVAPPLGSALADQVTPGPMTVHRVGDRNAALLRHLNELGLLPGTAVEFLEQEAFGGAFLVRLGDRIVRVAPQAAREVFVKRA